MNRLVLAIAFGLACLVTVQQAAAAPDDDRIIELRIKPGDLPPAVQKALDDWAPKTTDAITEAYRLTRGGRTVYRVLVEGKQRVRLIRVTAEGKVLSVQESKDRGRKQVPWDQLPEAVKKTMNEARGPQPNRGDIQRITVMERDGMKYYCADITDKEGLRIVWVDENGKVRDADPADELSLVEEKQIKSLKYDDLPKKVQDAVDKLRNHQELAHIQKIDGAKGKPDRYTMVIIQKGDDRRVILDETGKIIDDSVIERKADKK